MQRLRNTLKHPRARQMLVHAQLWRKSIVEEDRTHAPRELLTRHRVALQGWIPLSILTLIKPVGLKFQSLDICELRGTCPS